MPHGHDLCVRRHTGVDSAFDFRTQVPHGPGAVRLLIYRRPDDNARVQNEGQETLFNPRFGPNLSRICDTSVTPSRFGASSSKALTDVSEIKIWSGARDLKPGASRSRTPSRIVGNDRFQFRFCCTEDSRRPDLRRSSAVLLHEVLHEPWLASSVKRKDSAAEPCG